MSARYRLVDLLLASLVLFLLLAVASTMLAMVSLADWQGVCAANLRLFGQASAEYVASYGVFAPCDPWYMMPESIDGLERDPTASSEKFDPPQGWLLYQVGYVPFMGPTAPSSVQLWWQVPYGFRLASAYRGRDGVPPPAICPAAILENVMDEGSPEIDPDYSLEMVPI